MQNQRTLETLYTTIYGVPDLEAHEEDSLEHHGVLGMSWGRRHGPPYPLGGVDKRVARAEAKRKREKERRLKKLQKAAKKARKLKKREEKEAADIQKKKQKLVKKGDMDAIKKNAKLFTNEELQYIVERDEAKRAVLGKKERDEAQAMENFSRKMAQVANIAASAGTILGTVRQGAQMVNDFKATKLKDLEIEDKRRGAIQKEFEMRFGKDDHSPEAQRFIDRALAGEDYTTPKETKGEKAQREMEEDKAIRESNEYFDTMRKNDKAAKEREKAQKKADKSREKLQKQFDKVDKYRTATDGWSIEYESADDARRRMGEWTTKDERRSAIKSTLAPRTKWSSAPMKKVASSGSTKAGRSFVYNGQSLDVPDWFSGGSSPTKAQRQSVDAGKQFVGKSIKKADRSAYVRGQKGYYVPVSDWTGRSGGYLFK